MIATMREAWELMPRGRRVRFVQVGLLSIVVSGTEAVAALAIALLLGLVLEPGRVPEFPVVGDVTRFFPGVAYADLVVGTCIAFGLFFLIRGGLFLFQQYAVVKVTENTAVVLGDRLVEGYLSMPYEWHLQHSSPELIRNAWDNVNEVSVNVFQQMSVLLAEFVLAMAMIGVLLLTSVSLTAAAGLVLGGVLGITLAVVQPRLKRIGAIRQAAAKEALKALQHSFGGVRDLKVLGREVHFSKAFRRARHVMGVQRYKRGAMVYIPRVAIELAFLGLLLVGIAVAVQRGEVESVLATLGVFAYAGLRLQPSLQKISQALNSLRFGSAAVEELREGLELLDESSATRRQADASGRRLSLDDELVLDEVAFAYPGTDELAVHDLDLRVPAGSSLGVVGTTGGGKTTLLDLLCGLLTPTSGSVTVDGVDIHDDVRAWHRSIGVVHQASFLVDDTIARNVALGEPDDRIDHERVRRAVELAQLTAVVEELPDGLDTVAGERGVRLSGGQQQRVTVARALYREPSVLILDEGTASLDNETERRLIDGLAAIDGLTLVMVAHRLSTVEQCDQIVLLDRGTIAARGSYDQLISESRDFRSLAGTEDG